MLEPVAELLQRIRPVQPEAVNVADSEPHKLVLLVLIDGGVDDVAVVMVTTLLVPLSPQLFAHVAV